MKAIFAILISIILGLGVYVGVLFYQNSNTQDVDIENKDITFLKENNLTDIKIENLEDNIWTNDISIQSNLSDFQFPSTGFYLSIDIKKESELKTDYTKILIKNLSDYQFFCLNEILKQRRIEFSYYKNNQDLSLVVFMPDKNIREKMLKDFRYYKIEYELNFKK